MGSKTARRVFLVSVLALAAPFVSRCNSGGSPVGTGDTDCQVTASSCATSPDARMSFFVTSRTGTGNLGGLSGADAVCQQLGTDAGLGCRTWRAYLSTSTVNAKDRIPTGPFYNYNGTNVGTNASIHYPTPNPDPTAFTSATGIAADQTFTECGSRDFTYAVSGGTDHDIMTGTESDGTVSTGQTCNDWTSDSGSDTCVIGHSDWNGGATNGTWNDGNHPSAGCDVAGLASTGGKGRLYCFAVD